MKSIIKIKQMKLIIIAITTLGIMSTANAQNVGIGTTTPANKLSVVGKMDVTDSLGIGTTKPSQKLDVVGTTKTTKLQITAGATNGFVLQSDSIGNCSWVNPNTLIVTETDPKVGTLTSNTFQNGMVLHLPMDWCLIMELMWV